MKKQSLAERFNKNQLTGLLVEKDSSRLGCVSKMSTVPLIHVLDSQLNSATIEKAKMLEESKPIEEKRKKLAKYIPTEKNMRDEI